jgi:hypothetical protein
LKCEFKITIFQRHPIAYSPTRNWRYWLGQRTNLQAFGAKPPAGIVPEQNFISVPARIGKDEKMTRERIEAERLALDTCEFAEVIAQ